MSKLMDRRLMVYENIFGPEGCLPLPRGYIHVYDHNIKIPPSRLANRSQTLCGAFLGRVNESLYKWSRSHDQDGCHGCE